MSLALLGEGRTCLCVASDNSYYWKAVFNLKWPFLVFIVKLALQPTLKASVCVKAEKHVTVRGNDVLECLLSQRCSSPGSRQGVQGIRPHSHCCLLLKPTMKARPCVLAWALRKDGHMLLAKEFICEEGLCAFTHSLNTLRNMEQEFSGCGRGQHEHLHFSRK